MNLDEVKDQLTYRGGHLYWKEYKRGRRMGVALGSGNSDRYLIVTLSGERVGVHRH